MNLKKTSVIIILLITLIIGNSFTRLLKDTNIDNYKEDSFVSSFEEIDNTLDEPVIVYDGLTKEELDNKLNNVLHSTLTGTGDIFASYALELGVDPYLAVAIALHETGCYWNCSSLVNSCYNVGGMKGGGSYYCFGGSYAGFSSLDDGIKRYMDNLYYNYVARGLTTAEEINTIYAEDKSWASKVNNYIVMIKNS